MTIWTPINQGQITSGDIEGAISCVAYSFAYAVSDATNGRIHPTGNTIRDWTGDHLGGLELDQCDYAVFRNTGINFQTGVYTAGQFYGMLASGYGAVLLGGYKPIGATRFDGSPGFIGNHAVYVPPGLKVMDPLADGRRAGVYLYHGEAYPTSLINAYAAALRLGNGSVAGPQHFEASFVHLEPSGIPAKQYQLSITAGHWWQYEVVNSARLITGRERKNTGGFSGRCTAPARYNWPQVGPYQLVRMLTGSRGDATLGAGKGKWLATKAAHVTVREV